MDNSDKIIDGLEKTYKKLVEFKKYKKTPIVVSKEGRIVEIPPEEAITSKNVYTR